MTCHDNQILHRDVSHRNVMVTEDNHIKLIDFGLCHFIGDEHMTSRDEALGTFGFRAPECLGHADTHPSAQSDLYSAGKILWSMVTSQWPYPREDKYFTSLSLDAKLPEIPIAWHLQRIIEKT